MIAPIKLVQTLAKVGQKSASLLDLKALKRYGKEKGRTLSKLRLVLLKDTVKKPKREVTNGGKYLQRISVTQKFVYRKEFL